MSLADFLKRFGFLWFGLCVFSPSILAQDHGICVSGSVSDPTEKLAYASVFLLENGLFKYGAHTDLKGNFVLHDVEPGRYSLVVSWAGLIQLERAEFSIPVGSNFILDIVIPHLEVPASAEIAEAVKNSAGAKRTQKAWPVWLSRNRRTADSSPTGWVARLRERNRDNGGMWSWVNKLKMVLAPTH